jgi:hypothetical protein
LCILDNVVLRYTHTCPVPTITKEELLNRLGDYVERTERGNDVVRRNPRELPRRLRVLLLAVDGSHTVELYVQTLKGFGDIAMLLQELMGLGLVQLRAVNTPKAIVAPPAQPFAELHQLLDDSQFNSQSAADMMYGSTAAGGFDEMVRVAKLESPAFEPPSNLPPPAPVSPQVQKQQIESLFHLLDSLRGERHQLRHRLAKMDRLRAAAVRLDKENQRLYRNMFAFGTLSVALAVALLLALFRR